MRHLQKKIWQHQTQNFNLPEFPHYWIFRLQNEAGELGSTVDKIWRKKGLEIFRSAKEEADQDHNYLIDLFKDAADGAMSTEALVDEFADILIFLCLAASSFDIDLETAVKKKLEINTERVKSGYFEKIAKGKEK